MTMSDIREIAFTIGVVFTSIGACSAGVVISWKVFLFAVARVEREKETTRVLAEFPKMVVSMTTVQSALLALTQRFDNFTGVSTEREHSADDERKLQVAERGRVQSLDADAEAKGTA